jgi:hypothetical protein
VTEEVEGVLDLARALQRSGIDPETKRGRDFLEVEALGLLGQVDGAFQEAEVEIVGDQTGAEVDKGTLGEGRLLLAQAVEDHLDLKVDDGEFDQDGVGDLEVTLKEAGHGQQSWRKRSLPCSRIAIDGSQFGLEGGVKKGAAVEAEKGEELANAEHAFEEKLLLLGGCRGRFPGRDGHGSSGVR